MRAEASPARTVHRTVRLLAPLHADLTEWRLASGRPAGNSLVFPGHDGKARTEATSQSWRRRAFRRALDAAGIDPVERGEGEEATAPQPQKPRTTGASTAMELGGFEPPTSWCDAINLGC
jgi:hypothetical protein